MKHPFRPSPDLRAVLFDLDNTLAATDRFGHARRSGDRAAVREALHLVRPPSGLRAAVTELARHLPVGVVTVSPGWYAELLLGHLFPDVDWRVVVPAGMVDRLKPYPDALTHAVAQLGVADPSTVAYLGDSRDDMEAAYHAAVRPVLCTWLNKDPEARRLCADAVLSRPGQLLRYVQDPGSFLPPLEAALAAPEADTYRRRILKIDAHGEMLSVHVLGRYFVRQGDTLGLFTRHALSHQIARKEDPPPFPIPSEWTHCLGYYLSDLIEAKGIDTITIVPAKPGRDPRLERLLEEVAAEVEAGAADFVPDLFRFSPDAGQIKNVPHAERFAEVVRTLSLHRSGRGRNVLIVDDVLTGGGTLRAASDLLTADGARSVHRLAVAKTIGDSQFHVQREMVYCECMRPMVRRQRKSDGSEFYGCTGYPNHCQRTRPI